jgi:predicted aspartyl protease
MVKRILTVATLLLAAVAVAQNTVSKDAGTLAKDGQFAEALVACNAALAKNPNDPTCLLLKARLFVWMNKVHEAKVPILSLLKSPSHSKPPLEPDVRKAAFSLLGECCYRKDDFEDAAGFFRSAGKEEKAVQLEGFKGIKPNLITPRNTTAHIPFVVTDPLPVVTLTANGVQANFIIDTGASDVVLDLDFADKIGVRSLSNSTGTFAGGKTATESSGRLNSLQLGSITVRNLPVHMLNTKNFSSEEFHGPISGIIGTVLFYHFLATIDYPNNQLILAPRRSAHVAKQDVAIPFWLASDHLMVAWGRLGKSDARLFLIDTGLSGAAFTGPKSITDEAGIAVSMDNPQMGEGGGGKVQMAPYDIPSLSLGPIKEEKLIGVYGAFPDPFETSLGFHLSGIISHQFFRPYAVTFDFDQMRVILRSKPLTSKDVIFVTNQERASNLNLWFLLRGLMIR